MSDTSGGTMGKAAGLALAVNIVALWALGDYAGVKAPDYVGQATGAILAALFIYLAPFLPQKKRA